MTLATIRAHVWKTGGSDVMLYYKSNGNKPSLEQEFAEKKARKDSSANTPLGGGGEKEREDGTAIATEGGDGTAEGAVAS